MSQPKILQTAGRDAYAFPLLIRHLLANVAEQSSAEIVSGGLRFTYRQFVDRVRRLATALAARGVRPGDTIAVMDWDSHRYLECYFAIPMMGAILQTVNVRLSPMQIGYTLQQSGASVVLYHDDFRPLCDAICSHLSGLREAIPMTTPGVQSYEEWLDGTDPTYEFEDFDENAIATTFHTTGTTGDPKQVFFTHRQLVLHTLAFTSTLASQPQGQNLTRADVYMPITPMFHVHAWGAPYAVTMLGLKQVYPGRYDPSTLLRLRRTEDVSFSHCVPTLLRMLIDAAAGEPLGPWTIVIGGSALPPALVEEAFEVGITTLAGFGMSETGPVIALARGEAEDSHGLSRAGFALPLVYAKIDGKRGGELVLRAPWLTQGYGSQDASDTLWEDGWLHTGDVVEKDADGAIRIVDRLKDVIKSGGEWISSIDLEARLKEDAAVSEAAVVGIAHPRWGERPIAFVTAAPDEIISEERLYDALSKQAVAGQISRYAIPSIIHVADGLPRTSVGKIDKKALREIAIALAADAAAAVEAQSKVAGA